MMEKLPKMFFGHKLGPRMLNENKSKITKYIPERRHTPNRHAHIWDIFTPQSFKSLLFVVFLFLLLGALER